MATVALLSGCNGGESSSTSKDSSSGSQVSQSESYTTSEDSDDESEEDSSEESTSEQESSESSEESTSSDSEEPQNVHEVKVDHYNISYTPYLNEDSRTLLFEGKWSDYKSKEQVDFIYLDDEDELPYLTIDTYIALVNKDFKDGYQLNAKHEDKVSTFEVKKDDKTLATVKFDINKKQVTRSSGSIEGAIKPINELKNTVTDYIQMEEKTFIGEELDFVYSWAKTGFNTFTYQNKNYFPLSLLDMQLSRDTNRYFWYVGGEKAVYEVGDVKQFSQVSLTITSQTGSEVYRKTTDFASDVYNEKFGETTVSPGGGSLKTIKLPLYLAKYNRDSFYYAMDNFYGLGETIGYKSMVDFINNTVYAEKMLSPIGRERAEAYAKVCSILNDNHTGFTGSSTIDEGTGMGINYYQNLQLDRMALQRLLKERRDEQLKKEDKSDKEVRYSSDGKVAYFSFDEFASVVYDPVDGKPEGLDDSDTYLYFLKHLNAIKAKGGVEKVVIDDTLNGGGYLGQLCKLLCLMSKDNSSKIYYRNDENGAIGYASSKVDTNLDGKIDEKDVTFGNDFKFYILTTSYSFSCGNAFPKYAQDLGLATVIGSKSGGGECIVGGSRMPFNSIITYSSNTHLGYYDEKEKSFNGYEEGANPQIAYSGNYYDVNEIAKIINK